MRRAAILAAITVGACTGNIDATAPAGDVSQPRGPTAPGAPAPGKSAPGTPSAGACAVAVAPTPLRRLTRVEYNNTVRDLLGVTSRPADAFPVDDAATGFESNNIAPLTRVQAERYMEAAEKIAAQTDLGKILGCEPAAGEEPCARGFIERFGRRAFRRPLSAAEIDKLVALYRSKRARSDFASGVRLVLSAVLQSPAFLYRQETMPATGGKLAPLSGFELATRLSYFVWASTPDDRLLMQAESGALGQPQTLEAEVRRLLADARATDAVQSFYRQYLELAHFDAVSKDERLFPEFTLARASMREEPLRFADHLHRQGDRSFRTLLTASYSFVDATLAKHHALPAPTAPFARVEMPPGQRSGALTFAGPLTALSLPDQESPIHRGLFVRRSFLCQHVPEPPQDVDIVPPRVDPNASSRQRFEQHRKDPGCAGCHQLMDPIGFGFSHYDGIGRWRTLDGKSPVDARGELVGTDVDGAFVGARELGERLAGSREAQLCITKQWLRFALGRAERPQESCAVDAILQRFTDSKLDLRELMVAVATSDLFRQRPAGN